MCGGGGSNTTVQNADPWSGQQPYLQYGFQEAQRLYQNPPQYYPNQTFVPFSSQTEQALGMMQNRALQGSPVERATQNYVTNTLQNPGGQGTQAYLQGMMSAPNLSQGAAYAGVDPNLAARGSAGMNVVNPGLGSFGMASQAPEFAGETLQRAAAPTTLGRAQRAASVGTDPLSRYTSQDPTMAGSLDVAGLGTNPLAKYYSGGMGLGGAMGAAGVGSDTGLGGFGGATNPYLDQMFNTAAQRVTEQFQDEVVPTLQSRFAAAGGSGSGIERELGTDAAGELSQTLSQMAANIYGPAYESERDRQLQAAMTGGQQDIARRGLGSSLFQGVRGQDINAATAAGQQDIARRGLGSNLFTNLRGQNIGAAGTSGAQDIARRGQAQDFFLGAQGQGLQAADAAQRNALNQFQAGSNLFLGSQGQQLNAAQTMMQQDLGRRQLGANLYGIGGNLGLGAANASTNLLGTQGDIQGRAAALAPMASQFDYQNIGNLANVGQAVEGKAGEALQDSINRFNYSQTAPQDALARYIAAIQGNYGSTTTGTTDVEGNPMAGAVGGGLAGAAASAALAKAAPSMFTGTGALAGVNPWLWAIGALLGAAGSR